MECNSNDKIEIENVVIFEKVYKFELKISFVTIIKIGAFSNVV